jgi:hypothetical protein
MDFLMQHQRLGTAARLFQLNKLPRPQSGIDVAGARQLCRFDLNQQRGKTD